MTASPGFWPLTHPFFLPEDKQICLFVEKKKKVLFVSGKRNKEDFYRERRSWTAGVSDVIRCERKHIISQRGFHVASRGRGHFLLGRSCLVNIFREPGGDFSEDGFFSSLLAEKRL